MVALKRPGSTVNRFESIFVINKAISDTMAPASDLTRVGIEPAGRLTYELADGTLQEFSFGIAQIEFMGEITAGRVIFGPEGTEPILGVIALQSVGIIVDPRTESLKRLPAIPLK
jgi:predicted aspartyl protease